MHTIGLLYDRGNPNEGPLAARLNELCRLRTCTFAHVDHLVRWIVRGSPPDVLRPPAIPLLPHLRWRGGLQGPLFRFRMRGCDAVIFTRIDQAPLTNVVRGKRLGLWVYDDDTLFGRSAAHERTMVDACDRVFAASQALADRMAERTRADPRKFRVLPMAVDDAAVPAAVPSGPAPLDATRPTHRPLAGILGSIAPGRYQLDWIEQCVDRLPWLHWLFAGRIEWSNLRADETSLVRRLMANPRCRFIEGRPHSAGWRPDNPQLLYASVLDVALIPYRHHPTIEVASPARLLFHFAQGTPVLATSACRQLNDHGPLIERCDSAEDFIRALEDLRRQSFDDGRRAARWQTAHGNTTTHLARAMFSEMAGLIEGSV